MLKNCLFVYAVTTPLIMHLTKCAIEDIFQLSIFTPVVGRPASSGGFELTDCLNDPIFLIRNVKTNPVDFNSLG